VGLILGVYQERESDEDLDSIQVGGYGDFGAWRDFI
jgi:hypothetical protein